MKKILYVEFSSGWGGSSEALYNLLKFSSRDKYHPVVLITRQGRNFDRIGELKVKVMPMPLLALKHNIKDHLLFSYIKAMINLIFDIFPNSWRIWRIIRREKIDLVHTNTNIKDNLQAILAAKWARVPCVCHVRETRVLVKSEKYYRRFLGRIVVLNKEAFHIMSNGYDLKRIILIPDGLDLCLNVHEKDLQKIKEDFGLRGQFCVGILGRLVEGKGHDDFIRAAALILRNKPQIKFLIVGNDPDKNNLFEQNLRSLAHELRVDENLIFTGWRTDKNEILSVLDVLVQASSTFPEGFGLTCIEAMALKKPVVATNIPGPNFIVDEGVTGYLVPPACPQLLADAIIKLIQDPLLARSMGQDGRSRVERYFDIKNVVERVENMYEGIFEELITEKS